MRGEFDGRLALVTGAARGIGAAVARALFDEGARVLLTDIDAEAVAAAAATLSTSADRVRSAPLDVRNPEDVDQLVEWCEREWAPIDIGVNVAGVLSATTVLETDAATWRQTFSVNTDGVFLVSQALARRMTGRRAGVIVTVGSNAAHVPRHSMAAYAASKAAAAMFTRCLGLELAGAGIRCNLVSPGSTRTPMQESLWADASGESRVIAGSLETYKAGIPLGKIAEVSEVAAAVVFLASDRASHITMADIRVDGGASL